MMSGTLKVCCAGRGASSTKVAPERSAAEANGARGSSELTNTSHDFSPAVFGLSVSETVASRVTARFDALPGSYRLTVTLVSGFTSRRGSTSTPAAALTRVASTSVSRQRCT